MYSADVEFRFSATHKRRYLSSPTRSANAPRHAADRPDRCSTRHRHLQTGTRRSRVIAQPADRPSNVVGKGPCSSAMNQIHSVRAQCSYTEEK